MSQHWTEFLTSQGLPTDGSHFSAVADELIACENQNVVCPLIDHGIIRASGDEAASFLHNLLTNDINGMDAQTARFAGLCTPKGRLLALFLIWREGNDLLLALPQELLPAILKRLSMYVLRSKVKLSDASAERVLIGLATGSAGNPMPEELNASALPRFGVKPINAGQVIKLDERRSLIACAPEQALALWPQLATQAKPVGLAAWQWLEIAAGQPRVVAATQEAFVPQMLNMELPAVAGVSFTKGCYPGQEIVARTQYLGKVKRRTYRARITDDATVAAPGTPVFAPETGDQHCGALVSVAPAPGGKREVLVCVQSAAAQAGAVHLGSPDGVALEFLPLPYECA